MRSYPIPQYRQIWGWINDWGGKPYGLGWERESKWWISCDGWGVWVQSSWRHHEEGWWRWWRWWTQERCECDPPDQWTSTREKGIEGGHVSLWQLLNPIWICLWCSSVFLFSFPRKNKREKKRKKLLCQFGPLKVKNFCYL